MTVLEPLPWDTAFFGVSIARARAPSLTSAQLKDLRAEAAAAGYALVYVFLDRPLATALAWAPLVDERVDYHRPWDANALSAADDAPAVSSVPRDATVGADLLALGRAAGAHSRFRADPLFTEAAFGRLYDRWVRASVRREIADEFLVYDRGLGLVTGAVSGGELRIGLIAVDVAARGRGVGAALLEALPRHVAPASAFDAVAVATQADNRPACRFYERRGFRSRSRTYVYHVRMADAPSSIT